MRKKKGWCGPVRVYDAEEYYKSQIEELMQKIRIEEKYQSSQNTGTAFVVFKDGDMAKQMLDTKWVEKQLREKVAMQDARSLGVESLVLSKAYLESDIIWDNLKKSHLTAILKRTVLFLALVVVSLLILTPSYMVNAMSPLEQSLKESAGGFASYVQEWFAPMVTLCINFGVIPTLIDFSCELEDYRRKSSRQISIMNRIFFFMFMNTLIVPLAGST